MAFNNWPYTDFQDLNLDWILRIIRENQINIKALSDLLNGRTVRDIIIDLLRDMAERGELDDIVMDALFAQKFVQSEEEYEAYADAMAECVVSYLCNMAIGTSTSVVGTPVQNNPFVAVYCDVNSVLAPALLTYDTIVDGISSFGTYRIDGSWEPSQSGNHDVVTIGNNIYPILYNNCSGFVGMLTRGRKYSDSPWHLFFTDANASVRVLAGKALEFGDTDTTPWTVDFMNQRYTWRMCENMKSSGCTPFLIAKKVNGEFVVDDVAISRLRDGDIIFTGNPNVHPDRFHGISHCAMYFKNLDRLNRKASDYGVTVQPWHGNEETDYGYIAHCSGSTDGIVRGTMNVFRIETLERNMSSGFSDGAEFWGCNISANGLNSSKLHFGVSGEWVLTSCVVSNGARHNELESDGTIPYHTVRALYSGTQNGVFSFGQYRYAQPRSIANEGDTVDFNDYISPKTAGLYTFNNINITLVNGPTAGNTSVDGVSVPNPTNLYMMFEVQDCTTSAGYVVQTVTTLYHENPHKYERVINYGTGRASIWKVIY